MKSLLITIDGPAGAGKTTVSRKIADRLNYKYVDTGALYRGIAFEARIARVGQDDDIGLENLCSALNLNFVKDGRGLRLLSNNADITDQIRTPEISMMASAVSARPVVRKYLLDLQRNMGRKKGVVFEGRDMGTVVFPDADKKFYLDASQKVRAIRRYRELESKTFQILEDVEREIRLRDEHDRKREVAPMKPADDAVIVDCTDLSVNDVVERMLSYILK
ncbi:MAG: (d)CMP kinase [Desulfobacteraceae bacterium]|nr:(d)CMP kinase [Desulfobacteraceae bacterium]MBC2720638.1 (d)CMP kinase [Desulfobacteraceae bacterium]